MDGADVRCLRRGIQHGGVAGGARQRVSAFHYRGRQSKRDASYLQLRAAAPPRMAARWRWRLLPCRLSSPGLLPSPRLRVAAPYVRGNTETAGGHMLVHRAFSSSWLWQRLPTACGLWIIIFSENCCTLLDIAALSAASHCLAFSPRTQHSCWHAFLQPSLLPRYHLPSPLFTCLLPTTLPHNAHLSAVCFPTPARPLLPAGTTPHCSTATLPSCGVKHTPCALPFIRRAL